MANCTNENAISEACYTAVTMTFTCVCIGLIIIVIVIGNALVVLAVLRDRRLKQQLQNWLIVSLAIADFLVGLLVTPLTLIYEILGVWQFGDILCELWLALDVLFVTASILNLCAISLDRYWCVTDPVCYPSKRTPKRMMTIILVVWILAFAISFPPLVGWRTVRQPGQCSVSEEMTYVLYSASGSFFIPVTIILAVYAKIFQISRKRAIRKNQAAKQKNLLLVQSSTIAGDYFSTTTINDSLRDKNSLLKKFTRSSKKTSSTESTYTNHYNKQYRNQSATKTMPTPDYNSCDDRQTAPGDDQGTLVLSQSEVQQQLIWRRKMQKRRERQATVTLGLILAAFVVCWLPFFAVYVLGAVCCQPPEIIFDIFFWLGYCNSGLNPVIYNYLNPDYRRAFRKILTFNKL